MRGSSGKHLLLVGFYSASITNENYCKCDENIWLRLYKWFAYTDIAYIMESEKKKTFFHPVNPVKQFWSITLTYNGLTDHSCKYIQVVVNVIAWLF